MSNPTVFNWPSPDTQAVSLTQTLAGAGNLTINGTLSNFGTGLLLQAAFKGIYRLVTLTSVNDLHLVNFTITGTYQGQVISEVLAGPNSNTVASVNLYDSVTSISANGAAAAVSAGTGTTGATHWFNSNYQSSVANLAIQAEVLGTINYSFQTTLDDVQTVTPVVFTPIVAMTGATTSQLGSYSAPTAYSRVIINSSTNGSVLVTFLQQGIT